MGEVMRMQVPNTGHLTRMGFTQESRTQSGDDDPMANTAEVLATRQATELKRGADGTPCSIQYRYRKARCEISDEEYNYLREALCGDIRSDIRHP